MYEPVVITPEVAIRTWYGAQAMPGLYSLTQGVTYLSELTTNLLTTYAVPCDNLNQNQYIANTEIATHHVNTSGGYITIPATAFNNKAMTLVIQPGSTTTHTALIFIQSSLHPEAAYPINVNMRVSDNPKLYLHTLALNQQFELLAGLSVWPLLRRYASEWSKDFKFGSMRYVVKTEKYEV